MLKSKIETKNGKTCIYVDGKPVSPMAYTSYFDERGKFEDFINSGFDIFFVNVSFTTLPINPVTEFSPFRIGVFENPEREDYSEFETTVHRILRAHPSAVIFPRINISMPKWWVDSHPCDVYRTDKGALREIMFSDAFRTDGAQLLTRLIEHIKGSDYAHRVGGWMFCGGSTQEWFFRDFKGDICPGAEDTYRRWVKKEYGIDGANLPSLDEYAYSGVAAQQSENARRYALFSNLAIAETVDIFAETIKRATGYEQIVGTFYGYTFEARTATFGTYGLRRIIDSPNLDYFSSPNAYTLERCFGIDWADMMPVDSIRNHGKLCFIECDIRTYLTTGVQKARPGEYPDHIYTTNGVSVWAGPPTCELSQYALQKSFAHQITKASAIWWFDMWGGWYDDPTLMETLRQMKQLYDNEPLADSSDALSPEIVCFTDEQSHANLMTGSPHIDAIMNTRTAMGNTGVPYDSCMIEDAMHILPGYKAAVFPFPIPSEAGRRAMELCERMGIPYLTTTADHYELTVDEIREFYKDCGMHFYTEEKDVVYVGNGYIGLHSSIGGVKKLQLPRTYSVSSVFGADIPTKNTDCIEFELKANATALFTISR